MKYPKIKSYIRFYRYGGESKMVIVENPAIDSCVYFYENNIQFGMTCVDTRSVGEYDTYRFNDWAQVDRPPDHISRLQRFKWYHEKWKKYK